MTEMKIVSNINVVLNPELTGVSKVLINGELAKEVSHDTVETSQYIEKFQYQVGEDMYNVLLTNDGILVEYAARGINFQIAELLLDNREEVLSGEDTYMEIEEYESADNMFAKFMLPERVFHIELFKDI